MENVPTLLTFYTRMAVSSLVVKGRQMGIIDLSTIVITSNKGITLDLEGNVMPISNAKEAWPLQSSVQKELCLNLLVKLVSLAITP